jgi:hypothetical protein
MDCQDNGIPDECDIALGTSLDSNGNGAPDECDAQTPWPENSLDTFLCFDDAQCEFEAKCVQHLCYVPKHRYLSVALNPEQVPHTARRIRLQGGPALGWAGVPYLKNGLWLADVVSAPAYADTDNFTGEWPNILHITGCEIATDQTYEIQAIRLGQDISDENNYSAALVLHTPTKWGDVVASCPDDLCQPPQGTVNLDDIMAKIKRFQAVPVAPITWLDDDPSEGDAAPNQTINLNDIMNSVRGFQGEQYPGDGPLLCPQE